MKKCGRRIIEANASAGATQPAHAADRLPRCVLSVLALVSYLLAA
jgi:hypothetical protein